MTDGSKYIPYENRTGEESVVYFTRDLSPEGIMKAYRKVNSNISGKIAVKLHTGEPNGPNIVPPAWIKEILEKEESLKGATIVETNTFYQGDRYTTEQHRKTLKINGWDFTTVDIMDEEGTITLPVKGGKMTDRKLTRKINIQDSIFRVCSCGICQGKYYIVS